jgi:hypothetical protein
LKWTLAKVAGLAAHATDPNVMLKKAVHGFNQHGRRLLEKAVSFARKDVSLIPKQTEQVILTQTSKAPSQSLVQRLNTQGIVSRYFANNVTPFWAQQLRNAARFRTHSGSFPIYGDYRALGKRLSLLSFIGIGLASRPDIPEPSEEVAHEIKVLVLYKSCVGILAGNCICRQPWIASASPLFQSIMLLHLLESLGSLVCSER